MFALSPLSLACLHEGNVLRINASILLLKKQDFFDCQFRNSVDGVIQNLLEKREHGNCQGFVYSVASKCAQARIPHHNSSTFLTFLWTSTSSRSIKKAQENLVTIQPFWPKKPGQWCIDLGQRAVHVIWKEEQRN